MQIHSNTISIAHDNRSTAVPESTKSALASLALAMLLSSLGTSSANVALPTLAGVFQASFQDVQWIVLAYLLAITTMIVSAGRLGDMVGRRRLLLTGLAFFTLASLLCGVAPSLGLLVAFRVLQGLGAAIMMALATAMVREVVPQERTGSAMGLLGSTSAVGTALGPSLGGLLIAAFGWRAIFLINVPLAILTWFLSRRHLPADHSISNPRRADIDLAGSVWLVLSLGTYALAMTARGSRYDMTNGVLMILSLAALGVFLRTESRATSPLIRLGLFRIPMLSSSLATSILVATIIMATLVVGPFYLSRALHLETPVVGLVMTVGPLLAALTAIPSGRAVDRFGAHRMTLGGLMMILVGTLLLAALPGRFGIVGYVIPLSFVTAGYALFQTANNTSVMKGFPPDQRGVISGLLNLSRNLGLITGSSVMGTIFAFAAAHAKSTPTIATTTGMHTTFAVAAILAAIALVVAMLGQALAARSPCQHPDRAGD